MCPNIVIPHQPAYLPWSGFFSRLLGASQYVMLDHVQYRKNYWQNRNHVRDARGEKILLTVPVRSSLSTTIAETQIADDRWRARHWRTLCQSYARAPYWPEWKDRLKEIYDRPWELLVDLNEALIHLLLTGFGIDIPVVRSSTLNPQTDKGDMVLEVCQAVQASSVRIGIGAASYLAPEKFRATGVEVELATYSNPPYGRIPGDVPSDVSALDLLLHEGPNSREILAAGEKREMWTGNQA
ncbi:WbqC family protein [Streptoverticillium reticulum]|uniref:WbqC family protein n=1 Tax=Streptoverticillium reticulum TaxID=1433415 RepID=UPI0039BF616E